MTLWTAFVTAFLALCTALGLITTAAAAAVPQPQPEHNSSTRLTPPRPKPPLQRRTARERSLPPTMKQRIHAEAHNTIPACRHRPLMDITAGEPLPPSVPRPRSEPPNPFRRTARLQL